MKEIKPTRERRKAYYAYADMYGQEAADERCAEPNDSWYAVGMGMCAGFISFLFMFMAASDAMNGDGGELYAVIGLLSFSPYSLYLSSFTMSVGTKAPS